MNAVNISATSVMALREKTGAGMMECKKALTETKGDFENAINLLRQKGLSAAAKKSDRTAAEGLTAVKVVGNIGVVIEVNSETDFVGRNEQFQSLVKDIANCALESANIDELKEAKLSTGKSVNDGIIENIATIGEKLSLRRMDKLEVSQGVIGKYVHNEATNAHNEIIKDLGKIAVLVGLESNATDTTKLAEFGRKIAAHIAGINPQSLDASSLDPELIERERKVFFEQSKAAGKPDDIINKMVDGRIRKFLAEVVLLEQGFVYEPKISVAEAIKNIAKELGADIKITNFIRYVVGEGIEREEKNFADEVAAITKG